MANKAKVDETLDSQEITENHEADWQTDSEEKVVSTTLSQKGNLNYHEQTAIEDDEVGREQNQDEISSIKAATVLKK